MRIAIVSDIHGNRTAFEAVLKDLRDTSPDLIFHGGDLAGSGADSAGIVDHIRDLAWPGVAGNTDEMLYDAASLREFASQVTKTAPHLQTMFHAIEEMADADRVALGTERLAWLRSLPRQQNHGSLMLLHASPETLWRAPSPEAHDAELESTYGSLDQTMVVYGHIHHAYIRKTVNKLFVNTGSVSLSYDGDSRAAYLLLDDLNPCIRRVEYDVAKELNALAACRLPHADWIARMLSSARPQML